MSLRLPSLFVAAGGPDMMEDAAWMGELASWGRRIGRPDAILVVSAHWERRPLTLGPTEPVPLLYDFGGFPEHYYRVRYPAPGAPALAARVRDLVPDEVAQAPRRGLDHGAFLALMGLFPEADVPVLQVSMPGLDPGDLLAFGRALAPLRDEGVLVVASGFLVHDLQAIVEVAERVAPSARSFGELLKTLHDLPPDPPEWVREFDGWVADALARKDLEALLAYRSRAPHVDRALPTHEHFVPLFVAIGAGGGDPVSFPVTGFAYGVATRRSVQFG